MKYCWRGCSGFCVIVCALRVWALEMWSEILAAGGPISLVAVCVFFPKSNCTANSEHVNRADCTIQDNRINDTVMQEEEM